MKTVIVIGAGIGGLAIAARLAKLGHQVTLLEKNAAPGGRMLKLTRDGYNFDTGPTLFLMPAIFAETYTALGERMEEHLSLKRIDPTYRVHFHDGASIDLTSDMEHMRRQLDALEPGSFEAFLRFTAEGYRCYQASLKYFVGRNYTSIFQYFNPANLPLMFELKALQKHYANVSTYFRDPRLRAAFSFQNMYLGVSPYDALATYALLQYAEMGEGVWFPRGGMYAVIRDLEAIGRKLGVTFHYQSPVKRIDVDGRRAAGVTLQNGERLWADIIIANADLPYVYEKLLPDGVPGRLARMKYTSSALMFYWGVKGERRPELLHHNVFLADHQYKESFDRIFRDHTLPDEPSFYIAAPTRTEPQFAPPDGDAILALVPVGDIDDQHPQDWPGMQQRARDAIYKRLSALGIGDLRARTQFEESIAPLDYRDQLNLVKGAAFGLSHNFMQVGYLRPHNRHARYGNLYFVGASTHPGTGLPIVLLSAKLVEERVRQMTE
jgi:phytoene desaturase